MFHFNKAHLSDHSIPMWVIKSKGETHYVEHVDFENVSFSTKETPDNPHTKGSLKFKAHLELIENNGRKTAKMVGKPTTAALAPQG